METFLYVVIGVGVLLMIIGAATRKKRGHRRRYSSDGDSGDSWDSGDSSDSGSDSGCGGGCGGGGD